jgi:hypothetical protein
MPIPLLAPAIRTVLIEHSLSKMSADCCLALKIPETDSMKYRLGEVQNISHGRDAHVGFNILNAHGAPIVMFSYLDRADADKARALVEQAVAGAVVVKGFS